MSRLNVLFVPHPPILVSEIGNGNEYIAMDTLNGMKKLANRVGELQPKTIIYITPHGNAFENGISILLDETLKGDLAQFGHSEINFEKKCNQELSKEIVEVLEEQDCISLLLDEKMANYYSVNRRLDHGAMVPMYFVDQVYNDYNIVLMTPGFTGRVDNYKIGSVLAEIIENYGEEVLVICSGDLSHALKKEGPYDYHPSSKVFDVLINQAIEEVNPLKLMTMEQSLIKEAAQCGLNSFLIGLGLFDGIAAKSNILSYEGPFGVGYLTGTLEVDTQNTSKKKSVFDELREMKREQFKEKIKGEDDYIRLARMSIEKYVETQRKLSEEEVAHNFDEAFLEDVTGKRSGAFVSIHKKGELRGCIGTIAPTAEHLLEEIIYCGISACSNDPRFMPIKANELMDLDIKVDILFPAEVISEEEELDVKEYGVIVEQGMKRGLLLPNLEGIDSVEEQIAIAKRKAGITTDDNIVLKRFRVIRHEMV